MLFWEKAQGPLSLYTLYTHSELAQYVIIVVVVHHHIILFKSRITGFTVIANRIHFTYPWEEAGPSIATDSYAIAFSVEFQNEASEKRRKEGLSTAFRQ